MKKTYFCIDLKTFYASVECVERGLDPFKTDLIVADPSRSSGAICLAISPKMKARGIKNRCRVYEIPSDVKPIVAVPRMKKYMEYACRIYKIYQRYVSNSDIHVYSIDEAFLDVTSYLKYYDMSEVELASEIISEIYRETGITATAGIGDNLFLAKVSLDIIAKHKKNNIGYLNQDLFKEKLWLHQPLTDFWQIGPGIERRLNNLNIYTMKDIALTDSNILYKEFGVNAKYLIEHSRGLESCTIKDIKNYHSKSKSISNSQILFQDYNYYDAKKVLIEMIDNLLGRLILQGMATTNVSIYIGYSKDTISGLKYSISFSEATNSYRLLLREILKKYDEKIKKDYYVCRIGISFNNLVKKDISQTDLFNNHTEEDDEYNLENVIIKLRQKFGKSSLLRAISYTPHATALKRNKLIGGHNAE